MTVEFPWDGEPSVELHGNHVQGKFQLSFEMASALIKHRLDDACSKSD